MKPMIQRIGVFASMAIFVGVLFGLSIEAVDAREGIRGKARTSVNRPNRTAKLNRQARPNRAAKPTRQARPSVQGKPARPAKTDRMAPKAPAKGNRMAQKRPMNGGDKTINKGGASIQPINKKDINIIDNSKEIDIDIDHHGGGWYGGGHHHHHPVAAGVAFGVAAGVTAVAIGSVVNVLPAGCTTVIVGGIAYQQCGSVWYEPRYSGSNVTYVVVEAPQ